MANHSRPRAVNHAVEQHVQHLVQAAGMEWATRGELDQRHAVIGAQRRLPAQQQRVRVEDPAAPRIGRNAGDQCYRWFSGRTRPPYVDFREQR